MTFRVAVLVGTVLLCLSACTVPPAATSPTSPVVPSSVDDVPPPSDKVLALNLPIDRYLPSIDEIYTIEAATDRLVQRCMMEQGLTWSLVDRPVFGDWRNRRRYGVIEPSVARQYGFHAVPALLGPVEVYNEKVRRMNALTDRQRRAVNDQNVGCAPLAYAELRRGINQPDYSLANQLGGQSLYAAQREPDVRVALDRWSRCMLAAGYHYPDPLAASSDMRWSQSDKPDPLEIATADAAVRCEVQVDLVTIWSAADAFIQRAMIARNADYFAALELSKLKLMTAVKKVVNATA
jgi:hypothetical protein